MEIVYKIYKDCNNNKKKIDQVVSPCGRKTLYKAVEEIFKSFSRMNENLFIATNFIAESEIVPKHNYTLNS